MERTITHEILRWYNENTKMCLLIDGARQVGKTYAVHDFLVRNCKSFVEINLLENADARTLLSRAHDSEEIFVSLGALYPGAFVPGETVVFIDEVQECLNLMTAVKFLVQDGRFRFILSGSLLGVEKSEVRSMPVGYMTKLIMYPMNFEEFLTAFGMGRDTIDYLRDRFMTVMPINEALHNRIMQLFRLYILIGGMPAAVQAYLDTKDLVRVRDVHMSIRDMYEDDVSKYEKSSKLLLSEIFNLIPSELNAQNKRFKYTAIKPGRYTDNVENSFLWLTHAGVAIPVYCVDAPKYPLLMSKSRTLLKLFFSDVGLLSSMYFDDNVQVKILADDDDINFGAIYENVVAQELKSNGLVPYYYNSHKFGELDLLVERGDKVIPLEIKSGKNYQKHSALDRVLDVVDFKIDRGYVFSCNGDIRSEGKTVYMPIYMSMFLKKERKDSNVVEVDMSPWQTPGI